MKESSRSVSWRSGFKAPIIALGLLIAGNFAVDVARADDHQNLNSTVKGTFPFNETIIAAVQYVRGVTSCPQTVSPTQWPAPIG